MIIIDSIKKETNSLFSRLVCNVKINETYKKLWIETYSKNGQYFEDKCGDPFLIALVPFALFNRHNILVNVPISQELVYGVQEMLAPILNYHGGTHPIKIFTKQYYVPDKNTNKGVATSISLGVDSFSAIIKHLEYPLSNYKLTDLFFFSTDSIRPTDERMNKNVRTVSKELNLNLFEVWANFFNELNPPLDFPSHTYWMCAAICSLKKKWNKYYIASSYPTDTFTDLNHSDCSHYENLLLNSISTSDMKFILDGQYLPRFEKMEKISHSKIVCDYLIPCWSGNLRYNCNWCSKCMRTMLDLYTQGLLDNYNHVFDTQSFKEYSAYYLMYMCKEREKEFFKNPYNEYKNKHPKKCQELSSKAETISRKYNNNEDWPILAAVEDNIPSAMATQAHSLRNRGKDMQALELMKGAYLQNKYFSEEYVAMLIDIGGEKNLHEAMQIVESKKDKKIEDIEHLLIIYTQLGSKNKQTKLLKELETWKIVGTFFPKQYVSILISEKNIRAVEICKQFSESNSIAKLYLARLYASGLIVKPNLDTAIILLKEVMQTSPSYLDELVEVLIKKGTCESLEEAWIYTQTLISWNHPRGMHRLSKMYHEGIFVEKNIDLAIYWMEKAANYFKWAKWDLYVYYGERNMPKDLELRAKLLQELKRDKHPLAITLI